MKPGVDGLKLHTEVKQLFTDRGFPTEVRKGRQVGFFHGTGHGLGLEIHEFPRFQKTVFKPGQVLTVEPGLYYPGIGGARLEDVVVLTKTGTRHAFAFRKAARNLNERVLWRLILQICHAEQNRGICRAEPLGWREGFFDSLVCSE